jgi:hypothetical protein
VRRFMNTEYITNSLLLLPKLKEVASQPRPQQGTKEFYRWYVCNQMIDFPESDMCGLVESGEIVAVCYYTDWIDYHQMGYLVSFRRGAGRKLFEEYIRRNRYPRVYTEPINKEVEQVYRSWGFRGVAQCDPNFGEYWDEYLVYN